MRKASAVYLLDQKTILIVKGAQFLYLPGLHDSMETSLIRLSTWDIERAFALFNIELSGRKLDKICPDGYFSITSSPYIDGDFDADHTGGTFAQIEVEQVSPGTIAIRITEQATDDGEPSRYEMAYNGRYTIWWEPD